MRKTVLSFVYLVGFLVLCAASAGACGDKLLVLGRGVKLNDITGAHQAAILVYVPVGLPHTAALNDAQLQAALKKAGHKLHLVRDEDVLAEAVRSGKYDLVLVDIHDTSMAEEQVSVASVNTIVMPVVHDPADLGSAATRFRCVGNQKYHSCLSTIDTAIETKRRLDRQQHRESK